MGDDRIGISDTITRSVGEMWKCPKCGREFKNTEQDHFCVKPNSVDEYIAAQPENVRPLLQSIRETIRAAAPEATEKISWRMPTFWQGGTLSISRRSRNTSGCTQAAKLRPSSPNGSQDIRPVKEQFSCRLTNR